MVTVFHNGLVLFDYLPVRSTPAGLNTLMVCLRWWGTFGREGRWRFTALLWHQPERSLTLLALPMDPLRWGESKLPAN